MTTLNQNTILLIDGNNFVMRAYHGTSHVLSTPEGVDTTGITVALKMLTKYLQDFKPWLVLFIWDKGRPAWRSKMLSDIGIDYKGKRKKGDEREQKAIADAFATCKQWIAACGFQSLSHKDMEADDIISYLMNSPIGKSESRKVIVSSDKDLYQLLVDDNMEILTFTDQIFKRADFIEKYGFDPIYFPQFKAVVGDSSDNLPGVRLVGNKWAESACRESGSIHAYINANPQDSKVMRIKAQYKEYKIQLNAIKLKTPEQYREIVGELDFKIKRKVLPDFEKLFQLAMLWHLTASYIVGRKDYDNSLMEYYNRSFTK